MTFTQPSITWCNYEGDRGSDPQRADRTEKSDKSEKITQHASHTKIRFLQ